jgi:hypothetical protein
MEQLSKEFHNFSSATHALLSSTTRPYPPYRFAPRAKPDIGRHGKEKTAD